MAFREYNELDLPNIDHEMLDFWKKNHVFQESIDTRDGSQDFVFYEGPPSANGLPGIHHVVGRTIKDLFCRYKTLRGFQVKRKGGWDTHGLPVELQVEKSLNITKDDIGKKITVEEYNQKCKETVMLYKEQWDNITQKMGFWLDLDHPYLTYENSYMESVWYIIHQIFQKKMLYKGYRIQPYSPAAGTGLSTHELNQPGSYRDVTDTTVVASFEVTEDSIPKVEQAFGVQNIGHASFLAWTTTPWTLPGNTALTLGPNIEYVLISTFNPYTKEPQNVILAKELIPNWFKGKEEVNSKDALNVEKENYMILGSTLGKNLLQIRYNQLLAFGANHRDNIEGDSFVTIGGDFVTIEDGTGIVHTAPSFGADDRKVASENNIGELKIVDEEGKFLDDMDWLSNRYVKDYRDEADYKSPDIDIAIDLKKRGRAFNVQKYNHSYPHCWRTDKPIIYYPLDNWFINVTSIKDDLIKNNDLINWKPKSTGTGRFGQWLENIQDWNISRSRFWGTPLPIWSSDDKQIVICIASVQELKDKIVEANFSNALSQEQKDLNQTFLDNLESGKWDLHKPFIDYVTLESHGKALQREPEVIDVWFDSGSMPYAQWNYPFSHQDDFAHAYPADFIAEGVDQTRGWFYTLHAISTILYDRPAFKNVISNGLLLDKDGQKMSKRKGNVVDPVSTIDTYGADAVRWYIVSNSAPWENIRFDIKGVEESMRKFFGTLYNTYSFFALYANVDNYEYVESTKTSLKDRPELDRWIISKLNSLKQDVTSSLDDYEPTLAARAIQEFVDRNLSNWYVRLNRRRFWKNDVSEDKKMAYDTLYECLLTVSQLMSPIAPFFGDWLYKNLISDPKASVHTSYWFEIDLSSIDLELEKRIELAQNVTSLILSLRKKEQIKVRQPLNKVLIPIIDAKEQKLYESIEDIVKSEVNIKHFEYLNDDSGKFTKKAKPNFKILGKKLGKDMSAVGNQINNLSQQDIQKLETTGSIVLNVGDVQYVLNRDEIEISTSDMPGFLVASENNITLALDIMLTPALLDEGIAREFINRVQNLRKDYALNVTDKIEINYQENENFENVLTKYRDYIANEILATSINSTKTITNPLQLELNDVKLFMDFKKV